MKVRRIRKPVAALLAGIALVTVLAGCSLVSPQETLHEQTTSTGVNATVGSVFVGNAVLLTPVEGTPTSLVVTLVNQGTGAQRVTIGTRVGNAVVTVPRNGLLKIGDHNGKRVVFTDLNAPQGSIANVTFTNGNSAITLRVPVLGGQLDQYGDLVPTPTPTATP